MLAPARAQVMLSVSASPGPHSCIHSHTHQHTHIVTHSYIHLHTCSYVYILIAYPYTYTHIHTHNTHTHTQQSPGGDAPKQCTAVPSTLHGGTEPIVQSQSRLPSFLLKSTGTPSQGPVLVKSEGDLHEVVGEDPSGLATHEQNLAESGGIGHVWCFPWAGGRPWRWGHRGAETAWRGTTVQ